MHFEAEGNRKTQLMALLMTVVVVGGTIAYAMTAWQAAVARCAGQEHVRDFLAFGRAGFGRNCGIVHG